VGVRIEVLEVGVGGEEFILGDTVRHWVFDRFLPVVSPMGLHEGRWREAMVRIDCLCFCVVVGIRFGGC